MSLSRRSFVQTMGVGAAGTWIGSRGREASLFGLEPAYAAEASPIILSSNENPAGPGQAVLDAVRGAFGDTGRYPSATVDEVADLIAKKFSVKRENVLVGSGSTQLLRTSTHVFTTKTAGLVAAIPAYEECAGYARLIGHPVTGVKLNPELKMDLDALLGASKGSGLVFYCNPNNPVATAIGGKETRDYLTALGKASTNTTVLVDEAYFEYATMPGYETMIPVAIENPRVVVARTFSKCFGMAGLRVGYAIGHKDTIKKMGDWDGTSAVNLRGLAAAYSSLAGDQARLVAESKRNTDVRGFTMKWFSDRGYKPTDSQTNFIFVDIKRPARDFRAACAAEGVLVGRDFPPYEKSHARISIGTMAEMQKAVEVFGKALAKPAAAA